MNIDLWFRSHVERCLQQIWLAQTDQNAGRDVDPPELVTDGSGPLEDMSPDADGEYGFRSGTAACFVQLPPGDPQVVRVWGVAVRQVRRSARLLGELNDVNTRTRSAHVLLVGSSVIVEQMIHADGVSVDTLRQAIDAVAAVANDIGVLVAGVYGGETPFAIDFSLDDAA